MRQKTYHILKIIKRNCRWLLRLFLCLFLLPYASSGCGRPDLSNANHPDAALNSSEDNIGMGRYTETVSDLPDSLSNYSHKLFKLSDETLVLTDTAGPFMISKDNGASRLPEERAWHTRLLDAGASIIDIAVGPDNTVAIIYEPAIKDASESADSLHPELLLIDSDDTEMPVTIDSSNSRYYLNRIFITRSGRIFATAFLADNFYIFEIFKNGDSRQFLSLEEKEPEQLLLSDRLMILYGTKYEYPVIYDVESENYLEDTILSDFINSHTANISKWYLFDDPEGSLYLAGQGGLYRHTIGGNTIEQLIDGNLSVLNNPSCSIAGMISLDGHEFLAVFHNRKSAHFTYNPNIPAKPSELLKVYSLENNDTIRQAIALYLAENPDVYIQYNIGLTDNHAETREEAVKKLNTEIMAGNGPDILIMDDLPFDSYYKKGLLRDLTSIIRAIDNNDPLFTNIPNGMKDSGGIYMLPCELQLPVLFGKQSVISQMYDLESTADMIESLRKEYSRQDLLGIDTADDILHLFAVTSAPSWLTEYKTCNTQNISTFLEQTNRLYRTQRESSTKEQPEIYVVGTQRNIPDTLPPLKVIEYAGGYLPSFTCGILYNSHTYAEMCSVSQINGFESCGWQVMCGQNQHVFIPKTLIAISSAAHNPKCAEAFMQMCVSVENQSNLYYGLPVNRAALNSIFSSDKNITAGNHQDTGSLPYDCEFLADSEGRLITMDIYQPDEKAVAMLCTCIEASDTPYIADKTLEDAVYEYGISYLQGNIPLDEAVNAIKQKLTIRMTFRIFYRKYSCAIWKRRPYLHPPSMKRHGFCA